MISFAHNQPKTEDFELTAVLYALSDNVRLEIVERLADASEIASGDFKIAMPKSSLSHHLRLLRTSGVIATRRQGTALMNKLRMDDLEARYPRLIRTILRAKAA